MVLSFWATIFALAVGSVGVIQYVKGIPFLRNAPTWAWVIALPVVCGSGAALLAPFPIAVLVGALALTIAQLGYETLVQGIISFIDAQTGVNLKPPETAVPPKAA